MEVAQIIKQQSDVARKKLIETRTQQTLAEPAAFQGLLFVGNRHETVPFRLLTDKHLTPRAKTAWQLIKLNAQQFQGAAFPSYEELGCWLSDRGFQGKQLSRKTISQTLLLLRLTRWLTLCETVRNERGQILGNVYVMNDEPLGMMDCLQLNEDYLRLLNKSVKHKDPLIRDVATDILDELLEQKQLWHFVSHLDVIRHRYEQLKSGFVIAQQAVSIPENLAKAVEQTQRKLLSSKKELSQHPQELSQKEAKSPSSNRELSQENHAKSLILGSVPNRNSANEQYSTGTKKNKYSTGTVPEKHLASLQNLHLTVAEIEIATQSIYQLDEPIQEAVLFEAQQRIAAGNIKKPMGYLMSLIRRAKSGDFNPYLINKSVPTQAEPATKRTYATNILHTPATTQPVLKQNPLELIGKLSQSLNRGR